MIRFIIALDIGIAAFNLIVYLCSFFYGSLPPLFFGRMVPAVDGFSMLVSLPQMYYIIFYNRRNLPTTRLTWEYIADQLPINWKLPYKLAGYAISFNIIVTLVTMFWLGGSPETARGIYYISDHGRYVHSLTLHRYQFLQGLNWRMMATIEFAFMCFFIPCGLYIFPKDQVRFKDIR
jgi:hypothetical protein